VTIRDDEAIISDPGRMPVVAQRTKDGLVIHGRMTPLVLTGDEPARLAAFISGRPYIVRHPVTSPGQSPT
jgi:hypothetical protein